MVLTASTMLGLGTEAPDFRLPDVTTGETVSLDDFSGNKALLVMFICKHCPYVVHVQEELARLGNEYQTRNVGVVAIGANDVDAYPGDAPGELKSMAQEHGFQFPYCFDESQEIAKAYTAACTPDFFLFDQDRRLAYRGQLDDSRPGSDAPVTGEDLRGALDTVLAGDVPDPEQQPSLGCNIKWKPGNEPAYFGG